MNRRTVAYIGCSDSELPVLEAYLAEYLEPGIDGFTLCSGAGLWRNPAGDVERDSVAVVSILHNAPDTRDVKRAIACAARRACPSEEYIAFSTEAVTAEVGRLELYTRSPQGI